MTRSALVLLLAAGCHTERAPNVATWNYSLIAPPPRAAPVALEPPGLVREAIPPAPAAGWMWSAGYWDWVDERWVWVGGRWIEPRDGWELVGASYVRDEGRLFVEAPHWRRAVVTLGEPVEDYEPVVIAPRPAVAPLSVSSPEPVACAPCGGGWVGSMPVVTATPRSCRGGGGGGAYFPPAARPVGTVPGGNVAMAPHGARVPPSVTVAAPPVHFPTARPANVATATYPMRPASPPQGWPGPTWSPPSTPMHGTVNAAPSSGVGAPPRQGTIYATTPGVVRLPPFPARR